MERDVTTWVREDWDARARENAASSTCSRPVRFCRRQHEVVLRRWIWCLGLMRRDISCGIGRLMRPFAKLFKKVYGCDISPEMIERSKPYLEDLNNVETWVNDGRTLQPLTDNIADFVFSYIVFQHIPDRAVIVDYIRDSYRVLKPGGLFRFQVPGIEDTDEAKDAEKVREKSTWVGSLFAPSEIGALVRDAGFVDVTFRTIEANFVLLWVTARKPAA